MLLRPICDYLGIRICFRENSMTVINLMIYCIRVLVENIIYKSLSRAVDDLAVVNFLLTLVFLTVIAGSLS